MTSSAPGSEYRRWYDHDPVLIQVLELLRGFQEDVQAQAQVFIDKIEEQVGADTIEQFYAQSKPEKFGNRWYDNDPVVSKAVELLRIVPPDTQRKVAQRFLDAMKKQGISTELLSQVES